MVPQRYILLQTVLLVWALCARPSIAPTCKPPTIVNANSFHQPPASLQPRPLHPSLPKNSVQILSTTPLSTGDSKWIGIQKTQYQDCTGRIRTWEYAYRKCPHSPDGEGSNEAVGIVATVYRPSMEPAILLVKQFRLPVQKHVIEFPAGLVDHGEGSVTAALRELREETGFDSSLEGTTITVDAVRPNSVADPGLTSARGTSVMLRIDLSPTSNPEPDLQGSENIETILVPISQFSAYIEHYRKDHLIHSHVENFAIGLIVLSNSP